MRILTLGGAGAVCRHAVRDLAQFSSFDEIVIGDYDLAAAEALAAEIGDLRLSVLRVNAEDEAGLAETFRGFDVVLNGLPFKYDLPVTRACVEAGVNGLDVSTVESQWDLHPAAQEKGVLFIPGVGATPGVTNLMARHAADQLDEVNEIYIHFAAFRCLAPSPGLLRTTLWEFYPDEPSRVYYRNGEFHQVGPLQGLKTVNFPGPIGEQQVCIIPHPETRTLPASLGAKAVSVHGCFPPHVMRMVRVLLEAGLYGEQPVRFKDIQTTPLEMMSDLLIQLPESRQNPLWAYGLLVVVTGRKDDERLKITLWNRHPPQEEWGGEAAYYKNIGIPLSIGAQMIAQGRARSSGVLPPETALDPEPFFEELRRRGIEIHQQVERL